MHFTLRDSQAAAEQVAQAFSGQYYPYEEVDETDQQQHVYIEDLEDELADQPEDLQQMRHSCNVKERIDTFKTGGVGGGYQSPDCFIGFNSRDCSPEMLHGTPTQQEQRDMILQNGDMFKMSAESKFFVIEKSALELYCEYLGIPIDFFKVDGRLSLEGLGVNEEQLPAQRNSYYSQGRNSYEPNLEKVDAALGRLEQQVSCQKDFDMLLMKSPLLRESVLSGGERISVTINLPIQVENSQLLAVLEDGNTEGELRENLELHQDYYLIPEILWKSLLQWGVFQVDCDIATVLTPIQYNS